MDKAVTFKEFSLRKFTEKQDLDALYQVLGKPEVVRHMASKGISKNDCSLIISESLKHWEKHQIGSWAVEKNGEIIGWAGFKLWQQDEFELLIVLSKAHWGIGMLIYKSLINLAKNTFNLSSIVIVLPNSRRTFAFVVKRAGFKHIGEELFSGEPFQKFKLLL